MNIDEMKNKISMALKDPILQQGFEIICKENAELKGIKDVASLIKANNDTVITLMQLNNMLVSKSQQLTNAKELLKQFLEAKNGEDTYKAEWEAEQFLKECK